MSQLVESPVNVGGQSGIGGWLKKNLQLVLGLPISAWAIWQLVTSIDVREVGHYLSGANGWLLALCVLSIPVTMVAKTVRWRYLFQVGSVPPFQPMLSSLYIGNLMNTVLPARVGELARAFLIGRQKGVGTPVALGTVVLEKVLDLATLALILAGLVLLRGLPSLPDWLLVGAYTSAGLIVGGVVVLLVMVFVRRQVIGFMRTLEVRIPLLQRLHLAMLASSILEGLAGLGRPSVLPGVLFWSALTWSLAAISIGTAFAGVGLSVPISAVLLVLVVTNLGMAVPSAPGYVGVFHYLMVEALAPFGVDRSHAAGAALINHAIVFGNFILGGLWFLWRGGYSLGGLRSASEK